MAWGVPVLCEYYVFEFLREGIDNRNDFIPAVYRKRPTREKAILDVNY
jgi:hypothetical protein